jgi:4-hydroxythreonine-4-phosphate dehydrogenase
MIGFMEGVNITLGLPIIRTSPDHGTVWGKAGKGIADESATLNAIKIAIKLAIKKIKAI